MEALAETLPYLGLIVSLIGIGATIAALATSPKR